MSERDRNDGTTPRPAVWEALELPEPADPGPAFTARVLARVRAERSGSAAPSLPAWAHVAAAVALAAGIAGGYWMGAGAADGVASGDEALLAWGGDTLAEEYLAAGVEEAAP
jgi:hypothetical protein